MLPDTARELKARLSQRLSEAPSATASSLGGATAWSGVALGLAPVGPDQVHLAIRLVDQADADVVLRGLDEGAREEVDVRVIGRVRPLSSPTGWSPADLQRRVRPLRPGLSVGHPDVTAGTLGGFVRRPGADGLLVLSNNHVLADSDAASEGDPALQPGVADGGTAEDRIGTLAAFVRLGADPGNLVDAAVAALSAGVRATRRLPGRGPPGRRGRPGRGGPRRAGGKAGPDHRAHPRPDHRSGGRRRGGAVRRRGAHLRRPGGDRGPTGAFSAGGDSGSVIWRSRDRAPLGLLFAGSTEGGSAGGGVTFANPLATVLRELGVEWVSSAG